MAYAVLAESIKGRTLVLRGGRQRMTPGMISLRDDLIELPTGPRLRHRQGPRSLLRGDVREGHLAPVATLKMVIDLRGCLVGRVIGGAGVGPSLASV
jgi:hypothetical protein